MLYGYAMRETSVPALLQLKEVTFAADADVLRQIAQFFSEAATRMETGFFERCSHLHIGNVIDNWNKRFPTSDVIVLQPDGADDESAQ